MTALREWGHDVYDFKNPKPQTGFAWLQIDPDWQTWSNKEYLAALEHPRALQGYVSDMEALCTSDACVLVLPCGRSAHLELGYAVGSGSMRTAILLSPDHPTEPELMYKMVDWIGEDLNALRAKLSPA